LIKQKISDLSLSDIIEANITLDEVDVLLKQKFNILDTILYTDEKELV
jgi:hypothetical protein